MTSDNAETAVIFAGRIVGTADGTVVEDGAIRLSGSRIVAVGPRAALAPRAGESIRVLDFRPHTVIPGLIDVHTHLSLAGDGRSYEEMSRDPDEMMILAGVMNLRKHLQAGVTTVRDNGARNRVGFMLREGIAQGYVPGPRLLASGRPITCTGGHFHWCNEVADGEEEIRRAVRRLVHEGADHIKIMASGGGTAGTIPGRPSYSVGELEAAVHEAHSFGRLTVAHCRAKESMVRAVHAGLDLIEHAEFLDPDGVIRYDPSIAAMMQEAGVFISPTLQASGYPTVLALRRKREESGLTVAEAETLCSAEERLRTTPRRLPPAARRRPGAPDGRRLGLGLWQPGVRPPRLRSRALCPGRTDPRAGTPRGDGACRRGDRASRFDRSGRAGSGRRSGRSGRRPDKRCGRAESGSGGDTGRSSGSLDCLTVTRPRGPSCGVARSQPTRPRERAWPTTSQTE